MAVTTYPERRVHLQTIFATWTDCAVAYPDSDFTPPAPTNDPANPARYLVIDVEDFASDTGTMGGSAEISGRVRVDIWAEKRSGDGSIQAVAELLRTQFESFADTNPVGAVSSITFLEPLLGSAKLLGDPATWFGRTMTFPFTWLRG